MAKERFPGKRNNLDALCERYAIDNSRRTLHGALLDAEILAEVYIAMTRGQESLVMELSENTASEGAWTTDRSTQDIRARRVLRASAEEIAEHETLLAAIQKESKGKCIWLTGDGGDSRKTAEK